MAFWFFLSKSLVLHFCYIVLANAQPRQNHVIVFVAFNIGLRPLRSVHTRITIELESNQTDINCMSNDKAFHINHM